jgi:hypothetical protein
MTPAKASKPDWMGLLLPALGLALIIWWGIH